MVSVFCGGLNRQPAWDHSLQSRLHDAALFANETRSPVDLGAVRHAGARKNCLSVDGTRDLAVRP